MEGAYLVVGNVTMKMIVKTTLTRKTAATITLTTQRLFLVSLVNLFAGKLAFPIHGVVMETRIAQTTKTKRIVRPRLVKNGSIK